MDSLSVPAVALRALGLSEGTGKSAEAVLVEALSLRGLLLVLDNCEHLSDACALLADRLLHACAGVRILATSRQPLGVGGEQAYPVPSLTLPSAEDLDEGSGLLAIEKDPSCLLDYAGIRLFVHRVVRANPAFRLHRRNGRALAEACRRLDGIPLAIELAAARVRSQTVEDINRGLDKRFRLLTGGAGTALPRQQTLRRLIDWSYDLPSAEEKTLQTRLSVFAGGLTAEAAEKVCAGDASAAGFVTLEDWQILDLLTSLTEKSLVQSDVQDGERSSDRVPRYRLLETIRPYQRALDRERGSGSGAGAACSLMHRALRRGVDEAGRDGGPILAEPVGNRARQLSCRSGDLRCTEDS